MKEREDEVTERRGIRRARVEGDKVVECGGI